MDIFGVNACEISVTCSAPLHHGVWNGINIDLPHESHVIKLCPKITSLQPYSDKCRDEGQEHQNTLQGEEHTRATFSCQQRIYTQQS